MGHLLAQQLVAAGEQVLDVQPELGARVRLLAAGDANKNDPNDARPVAVAALRSPGTAGHSSIAAKIPPSAKTRVQVERPQRSEDERPGGAGCAAD
jgi:hypothetical protein